MTDATADVVEPPARKTGGVKIVGWIGIIIGILFIVVGVVAWVAVSAQLRAENITVAEDAVALGGQPVAGPITAYIQADIINHHALDATGGKTYAELDQDDPLRGVAMQASFLRASLFTSVVAFGVALFAVGVGLVTILFGWALMRLANAPVVVRRSAASGA